MLKVINKYTKETFCKSYNYKGLASYIYIKQFQGYVPNLLIIVMEK